MKALYLIINLLTISFPLIRSFEPRIRYAKQWPALFPAIAITALFFISWDILFTRHQVWGFNDTYLLGPHLLSLPLEEWLFFFTVPFASVFIYECVRYFFPNLQNSRITRPTTIALALLILAIGALNYERAYTFWNFVFCGSFLLSTGIKSPNWLAHFWTAYAIHLIPFLIVNGVLTGTFIDESIVWYDNEENLSIRIASIPVEDTAYALLLLLMNVTFLEKFRAHKSNHGPKHEHIELNKS
ncbi:lycopene cyclase domain-containing protein [Marinoscillum furvescens]|uniref:Lycopene cyclase domain-containing protein n=1 Tax=Marinoscillum furvescens DSM 4134 TaxID=1122208 RepID=A0A3D9LH07_MARFU|nr:lycopene cyclase domain-containing protein [Marinoscillum furvescens]REE05907.1 lycopene cyclase domain-containing protein [Marinoscillum furvescens DSM 4134]